MRRVYCRECEHYQMQLLGSIDAAYDRHCKKYPKVLHFPSHKSKVLGSIKTLNENNNCEGYTPKVPPEQGEVIFYEGEMPMPVSMALVIAGVVLAIPTTLVAILYIL